jgi:RNA polymerase sigma factor (sigma-70 family)
LDPVERDRQILSLRTQVEMLARRQSRRLQSKGVTFEDLVSAAWVGAIQAVDRFDPGQGFQLATFAERRISGAIADELRRRDHLGREHRRKVKAGQLPDVKVLPFRSKADIFRVRKSAKDDLERMDPADPRTLTSAALEASVDVGQIIGRANLRARELQIVRRCLLEGESQKEFSRREGIGESRTSQICTKAMTKLREAA